MKNVLRNVVVSVSLLAACMWLGGIVVLGAIVAPSVFHIVHAPDAADAMTHVFLSFDTLAMSAAIAIALTETLRSRIDSVRRIDLLRLTAAVVASVLAFVQGLSLSPHIAALHAAGAIRGVGDLGLELDRVHRLSELCGKSESLAVAAFVVLVVVSTPRSSGESAAPPAKNVAEGHDHED